MLEYLINTVEMDTEPNKNIRICGNFANWQKYMDNWQKYMDNWQKLNGIKRKYNDNWHKIFSNWNFIVF